MSLLKCFLNKFVYSQWETFQTDLFGDAFNYCHVSSHPATHKLNGMYTHISLLTSPPDIFPSIPILNTPPFFSLPFKVFTTNIPFSVSFSPSQLLSAPLFSNSFYLRNNLLWYSTFLSFLFHYNFKKEESILVVLPWKHVGITQGA